MYIRTIYTSLKYVWCVCICTNYGMNDNTSSIWMELILVGFPLPNQLSAKVKCCHCTSPKCIELVFVTPTKSAPLQLFCVRCFSNAIVLTQGTVFKHHFPPFNGDSPGAPTKAAKHSPYKSARVKAEIPLSAFKSGLTSRQNGSGSMKYGDGLFVNVGGWINTSW